jgi:tripartite-type tricarboxylate transporter receptor subunit TctC
MVSIVAKAAAKEAVMIQIHRRQALGGLMALMAGFRTQAASAQANYPTRPIHVIVPFPAGGVGDTVMRVLAPAMEKKLGQKLVIESKAGASGYIGMSEAARAAPDGYTILVASTSNFVINQFLMKMSFDPLTALPPIAMIAEIPIIFCSNPWVPVNNLSEFVQYAHAHRGQLNYGSPGNGSINHLLVEKLQQLAKIEMTHVPYRSAPQAALATLADEIQLFPMGFAVVGGQIRDGKLTALAVSTKERLPMLPDVPTVIEAGFPGLAISNWWGIAAPKGAPETITTLLNRTLTDALRDSTVAESFGALGMHVPTKTTAQFIASLRSEAEQWSDVIRRGKITIE